MPVFHQIVLKMVQEPPLHALRFPDNQSASEPTCERIGYNRTGRFLLNVTASNGVAGALIEYVVLAQFGFTKPDFNPTSNGPTRAFDRESLLENYRQND